jgi:hypothetical protein
MYTWTLTVLIHSIIRETDGRINENIFVRCHFVSCSRGEVPVRNPIQRKRFLKRKQRTELGPATTSWLWKLLENSIKWQYKNERVIYWIKKNNWSVLNIIDLKTHFKWIEIIVIQQKDLRDGGWKRERLWGMELGRWRKREGWKDWDMKWVRSRPD